MQDKRDVLTKEFAEKRKSLIENVAYDLHFKFEQKARKYKGKCKINFELKKTPVNPVVLNHIGDVKKVFVNGKKSAYSKKEFTLELTENLTKGGNVAEVEYESDYGHMGAGMHQFADIEDGAEYLYTHFEPFDAHRVFPCFDQPDLKATFNVTAEIPKSWTAISNEPTESETENDEKKILKFKETKKISTYLFELALGDYDFVEDSFNEIPLRIFFRKSLGKYIPHEEMFRITKQGLKFYSDFFDYPYPFGKYDQIFVPEFNFGAMEQPGAVTFTENFIVRRTPTRTDRANLAVTIAHEMAHMWFGDLVTMKWWDDLWLNESFADLMGYFSLFEATEFKDSWENFYARKAWAYAQDQYSTTHPIATIAEDTDIAFSNFDGISYAKGASVLKQLMFYIGLENFKHGLQKYFRKYEWGNTDLSDFLKCLEEASGMDLKEWFDMWIKTTGVNSITPEISCSENKIRDFKIIQKPSKNNNLLREHKAKAALFYNNKPQVFDVTYKGEETEVGEISGKEKPDFVFLNYHDYDYAKERFDEQSKEFVLENIGKVSDNLTRQMIYGSLWQMVRDAKLDPKDFLELVLENSEDESNLFSLERIFARTKAALMHYVSDNLFKFYCERFFDLSLKMLEKNLSKELKNAWFGILVFTSIGVSRHRFEKLVEILEDKIVFENFEFDQEKRWAIIARINAVNLEKAEEFIEKEKESDRSDRGEKFAALAEAANPKNKKKFWELYISGKGKSLDYIRDAMAGFFWENQREELRKYIPLFFDSVNEIFEKKDNYYSDAFFSLLFPMIYPEKEILEKTREHLKRLGNRYKLLKKNFQEAADDLERTLNILEKYG